MDASASLPEISFKEIRFEDLKEIPISDDILSLEDIKTKNFFEKTREAATLNWFKLNYNVANLTNSGSPEKARKFFKNAKSLVYVHNFAKKSELDHYVKPTPVKASDFKELGEQFGCFPAKDVIKVAPVDGGKCLSSVAYYLKRTFETNPKEAAAEFEGGVPYNAAVLQAVYFNFCIFKITNKSFTELEELLKLIIETYPKAKLEKIEKTFWKNAEALWKKKFDESSLPIFEATKAFLEAGKDATKENFLESVLASIKPLLLGAKMYCAVRSVAEHYSKKNLADLDRTKFIFGIAGLDLEAMHENVDLKTILNELKILEPGRYAIDLSFPGETVMHTIGIYVESQDSCHLMDANLAIGEIKQEELENVTTGILSKFYSLPVEGKKMLKNGYNLYKVTKHA